MKYFIGAQIDVSGLALDGAQMESLIELQSRYRDPNEEGVAEMPEQKHKDEFHGLCELFSPRELSAVQEHGGDLFQPGVPEPAHGVISGHGCSVGPQWTVRQRLFGSEI